MPLATKYLVGPGGATLVWADGRVENLPERSIVRLERRPRRITGLLIPLRGSGEVTYETPTWDRGRS